LEFVTESETPDDEPTDNLALVAQGLYIWVGVTLHVSRCRPIERLFNPAGDKRRRFKNHSWRRVVS